MKEIKEILEGIVQEHVELYWENPSDRPNDDYIVDSGILDDWGVRIDNENTLESAISSYVQKRLNLIYKEEIKT